MAKIQWQVFSGATDITSKVLSMNITQGREKYLDDYSGGSCTLTINNAGDYASVITYGSSIEVGSNGSSEYYGYFWVQEVVFNDYPGNTGLNTATITAVDWIGRCGRVFANNLVLPQSSCIGQLLKFDNQYGGPLPADMFIGASFGPTQSLASARTYSGSVNNYLNLLNATERGYLVIQATALFFVERSYVSNLPPIATTFGRTTSATQIAYESFERIQNGTQFINTATISPEGLADQTSVNSSSVTAYGPASYTSATVDYNTTQAKGNADWIANNFSNPSSLRFRCTLTDRAQNATALSSWLSQSWGANAPFGVSNPTVTFNYQVPGGSATSVNLVLEGFTINITPEQTTFDLSFSPLQYYQFFTLNSTTLGILDTSRLGW